MFPLYMYGMEMSLVRPAFISHLQLPLSSWERVASLLCSHSPVVEGVHGFGSSNNEGPKTYFQVRGCMQFGREPAGHGVPLPVSCLVREVKGILSLGVVSNNSPTTQTELS